MRRLTPATSSRSDIRSERGVALVLAMFMVLIASIVGMSLATTGRGQAISSLNYRSMSQARYAAESGLHSATNYLLNSYAAPGEDGADPIGAYTTATVAIVQYNNADVVLSSDANVAANYPISAKATAFSAASSGSLTMNNAPVLYRARARLLSMRQFTDAYAGLPATVQTWEVTGVGRLNGVSAADVEVSAIVERQTVPAFRYAAFATFNGCEALRFGGGGSTDSYDSSAALVGGEPVLDNSDGHVGTNGNLDAVGSTTVINGTLSTPRSGVGNCTSNNVTALEVSGGATVSDGLIELPQAIQMPTPPAISPAPPLTNVDFTKTGGCPAGVSYCTVSADGATIAPPTATTVVSLGNVDVKGGAIMRLQPGIYEVNSIKLTGNSRIIVDPGAGGPGAVIIRVAGTSVTTPIDLSGGTTVNTSFNPMNLQFVYGGSGTVKTTGGTQTSQVVYAPNATASLTGGADLYGAIVAHKITDMGGTAVHYDRRLQSASLTKGNPTMTTFSWSSF